MRKNINISSNHQWEFRKRFRKGAFGWRSQLAIKRVKEAVSEIKKTARKNSVLGAEGAVIFLEKVSSALEKVDSSSGAIGNAVNIAIDELAVIISKAEANDTLRDKWLERLYKAIQKDEMAYIELLPELWGEMCVTKYRASKWADRLVEGLRSYWNTRLRYFEGTYACLSSMFKAERFEELLELIKLEPYKSWSARIWGVKALVALNRIDEAVNYAEESRNIYNNDSAISSVCEDILLANNQKEEAYNRYSIEANQRGAYIATFRSIVKKYPEKDSREILNDLIKSTPGEEGKWFAAAKSSGYYDLAIKLVKDSPCNPKTLIKASQDFIDKAPDFAVESGLAALRWLIAGYGYDITAVEVLKAFDNTLKAAENAGCRDKVYWKINKIAGCESRVSRFVIDVLCKRLENEKQE